MPVVVQPTVRPIVHGKRRRKSEQKTEEEHKEGQKTPSVEHVDVHVPEVPPKKPAPAIVTDPDPKRRRQQPVVTADPDPIKGRFRHTFGGGPPSDPDPTTTDHTDSSATHSSTAGWSSHWTSQRRRMSESGTEPAGYTSVGRLSSTDSSKSDFPEENIDIVRQHRRKARSVSSGSAPRVEEEHIDIVQPARRRRKAPMYTTAESEGRRESEDIFPTRSSSAPPDRPERRPRRRLTITEKQHRKYQRERARKDAEAAKPVVPVPVPPRVDTRPQIIVLPGAGGGRAGPPGRPGAPGAPGGGGGGAAGAAAAAASSGAAGAAGAARKPEKKKKKKASSGITKAKKRYTDQRKIKMAAMRSLKAKRVREFAARTKKMPKKKRDQARREYKAKADARYKEMVTKFPPARGLRDMQSVLGLIAKLDTVRMAQ